MNERLPALLLFPAFLLFRFFAALFLHFQQPIPDRRFPWLAFARAIFDQATGIEAQSLRAFNVLGVQAAFLLRLLPELFAVGHTVHSYVYLSSSI